jgi:hypothetical protein
MKIAKEICFLAIRMAVKIRILRFFRQVQFYIDLIHAHKEFHVRCMSSSRAWLFGKSAPKGA